MTCSARELTGPASVFLGENENYFSFISSYFSFISSDVSGCRYLFLGVFLLPSVSTLLYVTSLLEKEKL